MILLFQAFSFFVFPFLSAEFPSRGERMMWGSVLLNPFFYEKPDSFQLSQA